MGAILDRSDTAWLNVTEYYGEQLLRLFLFFLVRTDHKVRDQFPRLLNGGSASGQTRDELCLLRVCGFCDVDCLDRGAGPDTLRSKSLAPSIAGRASPDNAGPARRPAAPCTRPGQSQRSNKIYASNEPRHASSVRNLICFATRNRVERQLRRCRAGATSVPDHWIFLCPWQIKSGAMQLGPDSMTDGIALGQARTLTRIAVMSSS